MSDPVKATKNLILILLFIFAFLFAISISGGDPVSFWKSLGSQILFLFIAFLIYSSSQYKKYLLGIDTKTIAKSLIFGTLIGILYVVLTNLIPSFAIAVPLLPNAISDQLRFFIVVIIAPIVETVFFLGALLAFVRSFNPNTKNRTIAIFIQAFAFAIFHLGAYVAGIYDLPASQGFLAFGANISAFISAVIFGVFTGFLVTSQKFKGLLIAIVIHLIINLSVYGKFAIISG